MNGEYREGTSDRPKTGSGKDYLDIENIPESNRTEEEREEDEKSGDVFEIGQPVAEQDLDTEAVWKGKKAVSGAKETVSSDQDFSEYGVSANAPKSAENILVSGGGKSIDEKKKKFKEDSFGVGRARQPHDKSMDKKPKKGIIRRFFGKN